MTEQEQQRNARRMTLNLYQLGALKTCGDMSSADVNEVLVYIATTLCGEAGELANYVKKVVWHGHKLDVNKLIDELGDTLWYIAIGAHLLGVELGDVGARNLDKLAKRYPDGFKQAKSISRRS